MRRSATLPETAAAALFFLAATIVLTWPIAPHSANGLADLWDAKLNAWILHWDYHQALRDPIHLFDANIFYPSRYALAFSENLFGAALFGFPLYAAGLPTLTVYNVVFLLGMFLSALAAWSLARDVTGDALASAVAGLVFAFCPWRIAQIPHIQFQWAAFLALALLFLLRYLDGGRRRDAAWFGACFAWNALCNLHYAIFGGFLVVLVLAFEGLVSGWSAFRPRLAAAVAALALAVLVVAPFLVPYALASKTYGMRRSDEEIDAFSGVWSDFLTAGGQNRTYARWTEQWGKAEGEFFPGLAALALAGAALARRRRSDKRPALRQARPQRRTLARVFDLLLLLAAGIWIAALSGRTAIGPLKVREPGRVAVAVTVLLLARLAVAFPRWSRFADLSDFLRRSRIGARPGLFAAISAAGILVALGTHTPYYRFLVESFGPVFRSIRAPSRGIVLFDLGLAVLAAWGLADLLRGRARWMRLAGAAAAVAVIGFEYRAFPVVVRPVDPRAPAAERWLATAEFSGGVAEWPLGTWYDQEHEFRSTAHWKPILNGASGFSPRSYDVLSAALAKDPIPDGVWDLLGQRRATLLLFHPDQVDGKAQKVYGAAVVRGFERGRIAPVRSFEHGAHRDLLFRLASAPAPALPPDPEPALTRSAISSLEHLQNPPFGFVDVPRSDAVAPSGSWAFGWALDDSGVARVVVAFDDLPGFDVPYGQPHPGPARVYPGYPNSARAGFGFTIPPLTPGRHVMKVTILARDGGRTDLLQTVRVP